MRSPLDCKSSISLVVSLVTTPLRVVPSEERIIVLRKVPLATTPEAR